MSIFLSLPRLYKLKAPGKLLQWDAITILENDGTGTIELQYGQEDGKIQTKIEKIKKGKNTGKKNETTAHEQAQIETKSKWFSQFDKGYVEDRDRALNGEMDRVLIPMKAQKYSDNTEKVVFPAFHQPKSDGVRCLAVKNSEGKFQLWSYKGKEYTSAPHIVRELNEYCSDLDLIDGELYNHDYKDNFEEIISLVRVQEPKPHHQKIQYHIYDMAAKIPFADRIDTVHEAIKGADFLLPVPTFIVEDHQQCEAMTRNRMYEGYEGGIIRNAESFYEDDTRSYNCLKDKVFTDAEFIAFDIEVTTRMAKDKDSGKMKEMVAVSFWCHAHNGKPFKAKMEGSQERAKSFIEDHSLWKDKDLIVRYFGLTVKNRVPRHPVGKAIRDYE